MINMCRRSVLSSNTTWLVFLLTWVLLLVLRQHCFGWQQRSHRHHHRLHNNQMIPPRAVRHDSPVNRNNHHLHNYHKFVRDMAIATWIGTITLFSPPLVVDNNNIPLIMASRTTTVSILSSASWMAHAIDLNAMDEEQLRQSLRPATKDRPQIVLTPSNRNDGIPVEKQPIVQGLLSLSNPQSQLRPQPTDIILITIRTMTQPDVILGGARIPVSATNNKFPFAFRMYLKNILPDQMQVWKTQAAETDLLIQALVCATTNASNDDYDSSSDNGKPPPQPTPCTPEQARLQAKGVAKLIRNLPGQEADQIIRAPVALPLA